MGIGWNDEGPVVEIGRKRLASRLAGVAQVFATRLPGDQCALDQPLRVEHHVIVRFAQTGAKFTHFVPGTPLPERFSPAPDSDRNDPGNVRMQPGNVGKGLLDTPVDLRVWKAAAQIADDGQVVHDVAERGGFDQQDAHQRVK